MPVDVLKLIEADALNAAGFVTNPTFTGSVWFTAGAARSIEGEFKVPKKNIAYAMWSSLAKPSPSDRSNWQSAVC